MNSFLYNAIALCLAASCALAQYQSTPAYGSGYQRKMAPSPQTYGQQQAAQYEQQSSYDERPAPVYQQRPYQAPKAASYAAPSSYAKPAAPRYEEPYHPPMPFAWGYDINDGYGGAQYHKENGDEYGKRTGSYGYTDAYGIYRQVDYVADEHGFRATIKTNEPGTANESPADVELHAYEPPSNYYAGNTYSAPAAPSSYQAPAAAAKPSYSRQAARPSQSYSAPRPSGGYKQASQYEQQAQQYSSSVIVPVYQKAAPAAPKATRAY